MEDKEDIKSNSMEANEDSIIKFVKEFVDIWNQHDAKTMVSCFVNDGASTVLLSSYV
jgi:hypothetical protein